MRSPRAGEPFVEVNCAAIPVNLLESELFGHERGAFTGAVAAKPGLFEMAHGGTLFLDEIGTLPLELQPKLLRALESRTIRRVGGQQGRTVDVRVLAATHVDLAQAVRRGEFREDLYYRLNVVVLVLPPLRDRAGDVELLAGTFVERIARGYGLPVPELGAAAGEALRRHRWPGNIRELRNVLERAVVLSPPRHRSRSRSSAPARPRRRGRHRRCPSRRRWTMWYEPPRGRCSTSPAATRARRPAGWGSPGRDCSGCSMARWTDARDGCTPCVPGSCCCSPPLAALLACSDSSGPTTTPSRRPN